MFGGQMMPVHILLCKITRKNVCVCEEGGGLFHAQTV